MDLVNKRLNILRNMVDDILFGIQQKHHKYKKDSKGEVDLKLVTYCTRLKIYNNIMDLIYRIKKDLPVDNLFRLLKKRIKVHTNQLRLLEQSNTDENKSTLMTIYNTLRLIMVQKVKLLYHQLLKEDAKS
jgi:hypothetical protein